jgi:hypothetical protein
MAISEEKALLLLGGEGGVFGTSQMKESKPPDSKMRLEENACYGLSFRDTM